MISKFSGLGGRTPSWTASAWPRFVGDIGSHLFAGVHRAREFGAHLVEGAREFADLILRADGDLLAEIALGDGVRGTRQFANGARDGARQEDAQQERHQSCAEAAVE
jgi:hypothetical protein